MVDTMNPTPQGTAPKRLWLTYAWKDNEDQDVDYVIGALQAQGIEVHFDRAQLLAGKRLWDQIDKGISDPNSSDAWAIYTTKNSLESEPCLEEIAYALDRCLRTRGGAFPIVGIFPEPLDREIIPSAIATRLYVTLQDGDWARSVSDGLGQTRRSFQAPPVDPFFMKTYKVDEEFVLEVRPRAGAWYNAAILVPEEERKLFTNYWPGPKGRPKKFGSKTGGGSTGTAGERKFVGENISDVVNTQVSAYAWFSAPPSLIMLGADDDTYVIDNPFSA